MTLDRILVHYDGSPRGDRALAAALSLAQSHDAHLIGCAIQIDPQMPSYIAGQVPASLIEQLLEQERERTDDLKAQFEATTDRSGWGARSEFVIMRGDPARALATAGRGCDLLIVGQSDPETEGQGDGELIGDLVLEAGRPVLAIPFAGKHEKVGNNVLVCWTDTAESARASSDAMAFLKKASSVTVLTITGTSSGKDVPGDPAAHYFSAKGIRTEARNAVMPGMEAGTVILNEAADIGADLIVMGAYGHSRIRESILGGATRTVLESMTAPVLFSH